jgi:hypothetical protein
MNSARFICLFEARASIAGLSRLASHCADAECIRALPKTFAAGT